MRIKYALATLATLALTIGATVVGAGTAHASTASATLAASLTGNWTDNGSAMPSIIQGGVGGNNLVVNMSYAHRPTAFGKVTGATLSVTFPDAGTITGTVPANGVIKWSNGSEWRQVFTGPIVYDINGVWLDAVSEMRITDIGGYLRVTLGNGRPTAVGFVVDASTIQVSFPDAGTYLGTVDPNGLIHWNNNTTWTRPIIF